MNITWVLVQYSDNEEPIPLWVIYQRKQKERAKEKRDALFIEARVREKLRAEDKRERKKKRLEKRKNDKVYLLLE